MAMLTVELGQTAPVDSLFSLQGQQGAIAVHLQLPDKDVNKKLPVVIICHGLGGNQNEPFISKIVADVLNDGMGVVRFDFNGHGDSEGEFQMMDALNIQDHGFSKTADQTAEYIAEWLKKYSK